MMTTEALAQAAREANRALVAAAEALEDCGQPLPTPKWERRLPFWEIQQSFRRAAAAALVLLLGCGSWLTLDAEAREAFTGWVRGIYEEVAIYHPGNTDHDQHFDYLPGWLPAGYKELLWNEGASGVTAVYINEYGKVLQFGYQYKNGGTSVLFDTQNMKLSRMTVNGASADLWIAESGGGFPVLIWVDQNNQAFYVSGDLQTEELIHFAESLEQQGSD